MTTIEKTVMLQVSVGESIRTRLKVQSIQKGFTMGNLTAQILDEALKKLENDA